ncbi:FG-GAP repeat domain-containing protein, partial [Cohnella suwonensis]
MNRYRSLKTIGERNLPILSSIRKTFVAIMAFTAMLLYFFALPANVSASTSPTFTSGTLPLTDSGTSNFGILQVGDFDNDGDIDILTQEGGTGTSVTLWTNDGSGSFADDGIGHFPASLPGLNLGTAARVADFDH